MIAKRRSVAMASQKNAGDGVVAEVVESTALIARRNSPP